MLKNPLWAFVCRDIYADLRVWEINLKLQTGATGNYSKILSFSPIKEESCSHQHRSLSSVSSR